MKSRLTYIILRLILALMPAFAFMAPAAAQNYVYAGETSALTVVPVPGENYVWELYNNVNSIDLAVVPGNCPAGEAFFVGNINTGSTVQVTWLVPGTYYFKVTATSSCNNNLAIGQIIVLHELPTAIIDPPSPICEGDPVNLTVQLTGVPPWSITVTDGINSWNFDNIMVSPYNLVIPVIPMVTTDYYITSVTDAYGTNTTESPHVTQVVKIRPVTSPISHQ